MARPVLPALLLVSLPLLPWGAERAPRPPETARVVFQGNAAFPEAALLAAGGLPAPARRRLFAPRTRIPESDVDMAVTEVLLFYRRQGFFEARVERSAFGPEEAVIQVEEGPRVFTASVSVRVEEGGGEAALLLAPLLGQLPLKEGDPFTADAYEGSAALLRRSLAEGGYPFAKVNPDAVVDLGAHTASASFRVEPGRKGVFGEVTFQGLVHGEEAQLRKVLTFRRGELYRLSELERSQEALYRTGLFESVILKPRKKGPEGEIPIVVQVKEGRHRRVKVGVGYGSEEKVRWQASWETVRVKDRMVNAGVSIRNSSLERQATFTVRRPYWPDRDTALAGETGWAWLKLPVFEYRSLFARGGVEHAFSPRWSVSLYAASERVFHFVPDGDFVFGGGGRGRRRGTLLSLPFKATFNQADDPYDPHRGFILAFTAEPTSGPRSSFVKTTAEGRLYLPAGGDRVLAARLKVGGILGGGSIGNIPPTRRFFAGGQSSLRAFRYGVLGPLAEEGKIQGGKGLLELSTEVRFPLSPALTGVLFADAGNAAREPFAAGGLTLYSGAGGGLRFKTPVGPVGLDLAFKLKRTPVDRSAYQLAFYVGYAF